MFERGHAKFMPKVLIFGQTSGNVVSKIPLV